MGPTTKQGLPKKPARPPPPAPHRPRSVHVGNPRRRRWSGGSPPAADAPSRPHTRLGSSGELSRMSCPHCAGLPLPRRDAEEVSHQPAEPSGGLHSELDHQQLPIPGELPKSL